MRLWPMFALRIGDSVYTFLYRQERSRFEWDDKSNLLKHHISFDTTSLVFDDPLHLETQDRDVDGEERWQTIGMAEGVLLLLVVHTVEDEEEEVIRIISARKAEAHERRRYEDNL